MGAHEGEKTEGKKEGRREPQECKEWRCVFVLREDGVGAGSGHQLPKRNSNPLKGRAHWFCNLHLFESCAWFSVISVGCAFPVFCRNDRSEEKHLVVC